MDVASDGSPHSFSAVATSRRSPTNCRGTANRWRATTLAPRVQPQPSRAPRRLALAAACRMTRTAIKLAPSRQRARMRNVTRPSAKWPTCKIRLPRRHSRPSRPWQRRKNRPRSRHSTRPRPPLAFRRNPRTLRPKGPQQKSRTPTRHRDPMPSPIQGPLHSPLRNRLGERTRSRIPSRMRNRTRIQIPTRM